MFLRAMRPIYTATSDASGCRIPTRTGTRSAAVSIDVAAVSGGSTMEALLADADAALYRAKAQGRHRVACAESVRDAAGSMVTAD